MHHARIRRQGAAKTCGNLLDHFMAVYMGPFYKTTNLKEIAHNKLMNKKLSQSVRFFIISCLNKPLKVYVLHTVANLDS